MRLLHTADWHLGRQFDGRALDDDHAHVLEQVYAVIVAEQPQALIIAGDLFDRAAPSEAAVRLFNDFVQRVVRDTETAIIVIAGNHDSADRIGAMGLLASRNRALVRGPLTAIEVPLILEDEFGPVAISGLPFAYEYAARECFHDTAIAAPVDVLRAQVAAAKEHVPAGARWVIAAHAFVSGAVVGESERSLSRAVGGIETVTVDVFEGAHYVALGHLHREQTVAGAEHICYSGSLLPFAFGEDDHDKGMLLVDLAEHGGIAKRFIPFQLKRRARTIRGTMEAILSEGALNPSQDFLRIVLTDDARAIDPMKRIREFYPNACLLEYEKDIALEAHHPGVARATKLTDPAEVIAEFLQFTRNSPPTDAEQALIAQALHGSAVESREPELEIA
ncbi:nuclease SbcCD, D subunit [Rhodomicrobium vannielii ATCC 17100]|uniref:Nuclease SbcCD subunit D n=1 Tax=Rhodomicrobium vannielii (strain ATCC 17100 / DSM 162 / LMG 4299 / NCIMB 10020 / ATH 3.1.1) TaxID=648757 RepID=E3I0P3_RHOVT|nr:exonuclease SbcCD subunit D [Rhodomicrobium vannielii]ADP71133.1 nuclease SbcCD, D subunit [Rhodomicrobium vannielii ATCC 17100]